jgi:YD repeat-containing protein
LVKRSDSLFGNLPETFSYDEHNRLLSNTVNGATVSVGYDEIGNITNKTDQQNNATYSYHATQKHAVTRIGNRLLTYDANGNALTDKGGEFNKDFIYSSKDHSVFLR